ncbi:MAG: peptidoglycan editing factor PgeF [Ktedonobacterales bacterium]
MIEQYTDHCEYLLFESLAAIPGLTHAVFTRRGGHSHAPFAGLNASFTTGDDPAIVRRNKDAIVSALELPLIGAMPVHGHRVVCIERDMLGNAPLEDDGTWPARLQAALRHISADAMLTDLPGFALCWAYGDCAPVLLYDPAHRAIAMIHAGWRGTAQAVVKHAVEAMTRRYATRPADLLAGIGPAIGDCCYAVGDHVYADFAANPFALEHAAFVESLADGPTPARWLLDIAGSNERQLLAVGVAAEHIERSGYCTGCRTDLFYSNRREPYPSGRFAVAIGLRAPTSQSRRTPILEGAPR